MKALREEVAAYPFDVQLDKTIYEMILTDSLKKLSATQRTAIFLRFWQPCSIEEVAKYLKISWDAADHLIDQAIGKLRAEFKTHEFYQRQTKKMNTKE